MDTENTNIKTLVFMGWGLRSIVRTLNLKISHVSLSKSLKTFRTWDIRKVDNRPDGLNEDLPTNYSIDFSYFTNGSHATEHHHRNKVNKFMFCVVTDKNDNVVYSHTYKDFTEDSQKINHILTDLKKMGLNVNGEVFNYQITWAQNILAGYITTFAGHGAIMQQFRRTVKKPYGDYEKAFTDIKKKWHNLVKRIGEENPLLNDFDFCTNYVKVFYHQDLTALNEITEALREKEKVKIKVVVPQ